MSGLFSAHKLSETIDEAIQTSGVVRAEDMPVLDTLYSYGDMPPWGKGPEQGLINQHGNGTQIFLCRLQLVSL